MRSMKPIKSSGKSTHWKLPKEKVHSFDFSSEWKEPRSYKKNFGFSIAECRKMIREVFEGIKDKPLRKM